MGEQIEKKFTWVLKKFSSLQDDKCYSRPFAVAGCYWHLLAHRKGDRNDGYLAVYLELADPASLPSGWKREVKFSLTLVNKGWGKSNQVLEEPVKTIEPLSSKEGNQASDASVSKSQGDSSRQMMEKTENASKGNLDDDDASEEGSDDDDDDTSDEGTDDGGLCEEDSDDGDASCPVSDDGGKDISSSNQSNALEDASHTVGNHGKRCNSVTAETEVSNGPKDDDEDSSHVSNDSARNGSSLDQVKSVEDASQTVENGGRGLKTVASVTETSNNVVKEIQPVKQTMHVNGFEVFSSQVESVSHIFKRHPDIAIGFCPKNQQIRRAYMNALLSLIEMLCQSPEKLSENDLNNADDTLVDLIDAGFKLDWLKTKLNEISEKKKMEQGSGARLQTMEEQLQKLKQMFLDLESQLQKEKVEALAARAPLSFNDIVC